MARALVLSCLLLAGAAGCFAPTSPSQRLADCAIDMNTATRFGRMDVAMDYVGATARADFAKRHSAWGRGVRIVDLEFNGLSIKEKDEAEVTVAITWQSPTDPNVHETRLTQHWKDNRGSWLLVSEVAEGDPGIFAPKESKLAVPAAPAAPPPESPARSQAPSRVIYDD